MNIKRILANLDFWLIGAVCILSVFGIICIGSATHINLGEDPSNYYSQMVWLGVGVVIMFLMLFVNYKFFSKYYLIIYGVNILMFIRQKRKRRHKMDIFRADRHTAVGIFKAYNYILPCEIN